MVTSRPPTARTGGAVAGARSWPSLPPPLSRGGGWRCAPGARPPRGGAARGVGIHLPRHTGVAKIGDLLSDKGVIGSSQAFQIYVGVTRAGPFEPGHYTMRENLGVRDAVNTLKSGPAKNAHFRLVLPPGLTVSEIADRVGALKGHTRDAFLQLAQSGAVRSKYQPADVTTLEGLLYPDTYFVTRNETDQQILTRLVSTFDRKADEI